MAAFTKQKGLVRSEYVASFFIAPSLEMNIVLNQRLRINYQQ